MKPQIADASDADRHTVTTLEDGILTFRLTRAEKHNALAPEMYAALADAARRAGEDPTVRCLVLRGLPDGAFSAGTDITRFLSVRTGDDGLVYEQQTQRILEELLDVPVPTVAVVEGMTLGAGLLLSAACDIRIATPTARFGVPVARTLGNCVSQFSYDLLADRLGAALTLQMLILSHTIDAAQAAAIGFVADVAPAGTLNAALADLLDRISGNAPLTIWAAKQADRYRRTGSGDPTQFIRRCYGSSDFRRAVSGFLACRPVTWQGE